MKKLYKAEKIRRALSEGLSPKEIAEQVKVPVASVYTERWKMKKAEDSVFSVPEKKVAKPKKDPQLRFLEEELEVMNGIANDCASVISYLQVRINSLR